MPKREVEEEEAFPRSRPNDRDDKAGIGRSLAGSGTETVGGAIGSQGPKRRKLGRARLGEAGQGDQDAYVEHTAQHSSKYVKRLQRVDFVEGTLLIAAVQEATEEELVLNLPFNLVGYAARSQAIEQDSARGQLPAITELYSVGQLVVAVVTSVSVSETGRGHFHRIELSLRPSLVNAGLGADGIIPDMWLPVVVQDEQEHVYGLDFGVQGIRGVLKKSEVSGVPVPLCPGLIIQVAVKVNNVPTGVVTCGTTAGKSLGANALLTLDSLKAGFLVSARVENVLASSQHSTIGQGQHANDGLIMNFCGSLTGVIHYHHQGHGVLGTMAIKSKQRVTARVLAVVPGSPAIVHLTLLPHILDWTPQIEAVAAIRVGDRLEGEIIDFVPRYGCRLRCSPHSSSAGINVQISGFCPCSRLADKGVDSTPESIDVGTKVPCRVLTHNFLETAVVVTRRPYDLHADTLVAVSELTPGQLVVGPITQVTDFGVFVKISEYITGLVHLRQLTDVPLAKVPKRFQVGTKLKCRVLKVDPSKRQVSLTAKKALVRDPFQLREFDLARKDMLVTGYVSKIQSCGAIVSFFGDVFGLIHSTEMELNEAPTLAMAVRCRIVGLNRKRKRLSLSLNLENGRAPDEFAEELAANMGDAANVSAGDLASNIRVLRCVKDGIIVRFDTLQSGRVLAFEGYVPLPHLTDDLDLAKVQHATLLSRLGLASALGGVKDRTEPSSDIDGSAEKADTMTEYGVASEGVVLARRFELKDTERTDESTELLAFTLVSLKPSLRLAVAAGAFVTDLSQLQESRLYTGYAKEVREFGVLLSVGAWRLSGVALKHQIAEHFVEKPSDEVMPGQTLRVLVMKIDAERKRFLADLRPSLVTDADTPLLQREAEALNLFFETRAALTATRLRPAEQELSLAPGSVIQASVSAVKGYGALLSLVAHESLTAVVLKENMPESTSLQEGEVVSCAVLDFNPDSRIVDVSLQKELVMHSTGGLIPVNGASKKRRKTGSSRVSCVGGAHCAQVELLVLPALQKSAYSVLWSKSPPTVVFTPPFGERRWETPRAVVLHTARRTGIDGPEYLVARCPHGDGGVHSRPRVPRILRPQEELQIGSPVTMRVQNIRGLQMVCSAPVGLRGYVHATQMVDTGDMIGSSGHLPFEGFKKHSVLEARILKMQEHQMKRGTQNRKIWRLELTCRPSLLQPHDVGDYAKATVRWSNLKKGMQVPAVVSVITRNSLHLEVAPGISGKVSLLDISPNLDILNNISKHVQVGQVFKTWVLQVVKSKKELDLALHKVSAPALDSGQGFKVLGVLLSLEDVARKGIAATFRLPGGRRGIAHITELFDFWVPFPIKRLTVGQIYEVVIIHGTDETPGGKVELSLRASAVFGRKEGPEEKRPLTIGDLKVGQKVSGYVLNAGPKGVFVALSRTLIARIRLKMLSDGLTLKDTVAQLHPTGELIRDATVTEIDEGKGQVELSLRRGSLTVEQLSVGDVVSCRVRSVERYGVFVRLDNSLVDALIHKSEVSDTASVSLDSYKPGVCISRAKVIKIEGGKVGLSIKASSFNENELEDEADDDDDDHDDMAIDQQLGGEVATPTSEGTGAKAKRGADDSGLRSISKHKIRTALNCKEVDSDAEAPWDQAMEANTSSLNLGADFEFAEFRVANHSNSEDDAEGGHSEGGAEADNNLKPSKRQKKALKMAKTKELQQQEVDNAEAHWATDPRSVEDFERLLLSKGDTSIVWIRYMAFHLKMSDLERARQVAERAVKHVGFTDARERFNTWVAYMNLECTFGTEETANAVFRRAASHNSAKHVHLQLAQIHERNKKSQLATRIYETCCNKFSHSKKVWLAFLTFLYQQGDLEGGRKTLPRCLTALPRRKHALVVSKAALLEYQHGSAERGRSVFEGLLDSYPKRTDLWSVYIDAHIRAHTPPTVASPDLITVRALLEKCCSMRLKAVKMRFFFKRWLDFETRWGDAESQERVRARAREFVEEQFA